MRPDAVNQVRVAPGACERTDAELIDRRDFAQTELRSARPAIADLVVLAVDEDERALLGVQNARTATIQMAQDPEAEDDRVLECDRLGALSADRGPRVRHLEHPRRKRCVTPVCVGLVLPHPRGSIVGVRGAPRYFPQ